MVFSDKDKILIKSLYLKGYKGVDRRISGEKLGKAAMLISCLKSCGTHEAQLTGGQAAAVRTVPALKKMLRQLML